MTEALRVIERERVAVLEAATARLLLSCSDFIAGFVPPDYLLDGILQRRFIYSLTGATGAGKTAILLLLALHGAQGWSVGDRLMGRGRVVYLAGENPDDVRMRLIAMADKVGVVLDELDIHFVSGTFSIPKLFDRVADEVSRLGGADLVIVDTSAAYSTETVDDENSNAQLGNHARTLRQLTTLQGGPCVLVACHPVKNATNDNLQPRGGGAFIAEMDGNLVCLKRDAIVDLHWQGKFRGPDFEPLGFQLLTVTCDALKDSKGRLIPTVMAKSLSEKTRADLTAAARRDEDEVLLLLAKNAATSIAGIAETLAWQTSTHQPHKSRVHRALEKLRPKFVTLERGQWQLTPKGKGEADRLHGEANSVKG